jgi:hypothetical protein
MAALLAHCVTQWVENTSIVFVDDLAAATNAKRNNGEGRQRFRAKAE